MKQAAYRPDIDGLRAVAVLLVVLFHFDLMRALDAGFIGVDVFFVLSGFLIVPTIRQQLAQHDFRFRAFYVRRIRRLAPALMATLILTVTAGLVILMPSELVALAKETIAAELYVSNAYYWRSLDYFGLQADTSFLLHTWSLGVEEQFYLSFPPLLWLAAKIAPRRLTAVLITIFLLSFVLNLACVHWKPQATFYLLPTRAWEFAAGALTPVLSRQLGGWPLRRGWFALPGLGLLVLSCAVYQPTMAFPGWFAMLPVLATVALLIAGEDPKAWWRRVASLRAPVYVGRISYELYLVHWPVRVFAPMLVLDYSLPARWSAAAVSFVLAAGIYHLVEQPIRTRRWLARERRLVVTYTGVTAASLVGIGAVVQEKGLPGRFGPASLALAAAGDDADPRFRRCEGRTVGLCGLGDAAVAPTWLVYGDSHADATAAAFDGYLRAQHQAGLLTFLSGCLPLVDSGDGNCRAFNQGIKTLLAERSGLRHVVLVSTWRQPLERRYTDARGHIVSGAAALRAFDEAFDRTMSAHLAGGRQVAVWLPVPGARRTVPATLARNVQWRRRWPIGYSFSEYERSFAFLTAALTRNPAVGAIRPARYICAGGPCAVTRDGRPLYHDDAHPAGSQASFYQSIIARDLKAAASGRLARRTR